MNEQGRKEFGAYLKKLRAMKEMTQKDAARDASISAPYLAQLERGERNPPSRRILARLAELYGVPSEELWQKAEYAEGRSKKPQLDAARVEWAFEAAATDPTFSYGHRARSGPLTVEQKAWFVQLYEKSTGKRLLVGEEQSVENESEEAAEE